MKFSTRAGSAVFITGFGTLGREEQSADSLFLLFQSVVSTTLLCERGCKFCFVKIVAGSSDEPIPSYVHKEISMCDATFFLTEDTQS